MGGLTRPLPRSHSWGLSPSGTALLILRFSRAFLRGVQTNRALKDSSGTHAWQRDGSSVLMEGSSLSPPLMMMKGGFFDVEKNYLVVAEMILLWWRHTVIGWYDGFTWEGLASRLSADSDLSRLEIKKVTGEIEIKGGKNLLLTVDELKLWALISTLKWWLIIINYHEFIM